MLGQWPNLNVVVLGGNGINIEEIYIQGECKVIPQTFGCGYTQWNSEIHVYEHVS
jgi:hypothetical protein